MPSSSPVASITATEGGPQAVKIFIKFSRQLHYAAMTVFTDWPRVETTEWADLQRIDLPSPEVVRREPGDWQAAQWLRESLQQVRRAEEL